MHVERTHVERRRAFCVKLGLHVDALHISARENMQCHEFRLVVQVRSVLNGVTARSQQLGRVNVTVLCGANVRCYRICGVRSVRDEEADEMVIDIC